MPAIPASTEDATRIVSLWQQRRRDVAAAWRDAQWSKFDHVCNENITAILQHHARITRDLDAELTSALALLDAW